MTENTFSSQELLERAEQLQQMPKAHAAIAYEAEQKPFLSGILVFSDIGCVWLAARHHRLDYIWARLIGKIPMLIATGLFFAGSATATEVAHMKTLGGIGSAIYVIPKLNQRRNAAQAAMKFVAATKPSIGA